MLNRIETLKTGFPQLPAKDQDFAKSLVRQHASKGHLSEKQWLWVDKLADVIEGVPDFTVAQKPDCGPYARVIAMFLKAQSPKLKSPNMTLSIGSGHDVMLKLRDGKFGPWIKLETKWSTVHGLIDAKGFLTVKTYSHSQEKVEKAMHRALGALMADPAGFASAKGKELGCCIFCNSELSDEKSIAWGYGPTCAKNWGLPHGKK